MKLVYVILLFTMGYSNLLHASQLRAGFVKDDVLKIVSMEDEKVVDEIDIHKVNEIGAIKRISKSKEGFYLFDIVILKNNGQQFKIVKLTSDGEVVTFANGWGSNLFDNKRLVYFIDEKSKKPKVVRFDGSVEFEVSDNGVYEYGSYFQPNIARVNGNSLIFTRGYANAPGILNLNDGLISFEGNLENYLILDSGKNNFLVKDEKGMFYLFDLNLHKFTPLIEKNGLNLMVLQDGQAYGTLTKFSFLKMSEYREIVRLKMDSLSIENLESASKFGRFLNFFVEFKNLD